MSRFGIYIAKFNKRVLDVKQYKNIESAYVIGEVNLEADKYKDFSEIPDVIRDRILDTARHVDYIPNLDWTRKWTDKEVLIELGLPEDFLDE